MKAGFKKFIIAFAIVLLAATASNSTEVHAKAKTYTVTFVYGMNINTQQVRKGKDAVVPTNVDVPGFIFAGWTDVATNIQSDKVILGMYTPTVKQVSEEVSSNVIKYNNDVSAPGEPWWDLSLKGEPGKTCVVRWYNGHNGELWKTDVVPYGTSLDDPANPCMDHMDFVGWQGSWKNITEDRNICAWYYHTNKVTFRDGVEGGIFATFWIRDGETSKEPSVPSHWDEGWTFDKFSDSLGPINGDKEITAIYKRR